MADNRTGAFGDAELSERASGVPLALTPRSPADGAGAEGRRAEREVQQPPALAIGFLVHFLLVHARNVSVPVAAAEAGASTWQWQWQSWTIDVNCVVRKPRR